MSQPVPPIVFEALHDDVAIPQRQTAEAAGHDLRAYLSGQLVQVLRADSGEHGEVEADGSLELHPGDVALVPTGFRARLPTGFEAQIRLRSSLAFQKGLILPNAPGTIDADYPDEWLVMVKNDSIRTVVLEHGERIAQAIIMPFCAPRWVAGPVTRSTDRTGGLGSTGPS
jgi:dUTP pyrophosphatase